MALIPGIQSTTDAAATQAAAKAAPSDAASASLNYNSFLKLFMTELKNQDPTSPMDTTQQMAQLASFSQVEQQIKTNTNLQSLISQNLLSQAGNLIGMQVTGTDKTTGIISSIEIGDSTMTATLTDGKTVDLTSGVKISAPSAN